MKRLHLILVILALLAGLLVTSSATATPAAKELTIKHFVCSETGGKLWSTKNGMHLRGLANRGQIVSTDPRLAGTSVIIFNADVNPSTGTGAGYATAVLLPAADNIHGTWQGTFKEQNPATPEKRTGTAFFRGTDDLKGLELTMKVKGTTDMSGAPAACPNPTAADILTVRIWRTK